MDFLNKLNPKSKKLGVFIISILIFMGNGLLGSPLDEPTLEKILATAAAYLLGQGIADHGWSGAITGARRAAKEGKDVVALVTSVLATKNGQPPATDSAAPGPLEEA